MAGAFKSTITALAGKHNILIKDPGIEAWANMRETTHYYFRWTPRTVAISFIGVGVIPVALYETILYWLVSILLIFDFYNFCEFEIMEILVNQT